MAASDQQSRNHRTLDVIFGVSCLVLFLSTLGMFYLDSRQPYKVSQRTFRDVEATLATQQMVQQLPPRAAIEAANRELQRAQEELFAVRAEFSNEESAIQGKLTTAQGTAQKLKSRLDGEMSAYNITVDEAAKQPEQSANAERFQRLITSKKETLTKLQNDLDKVNTEIDQLNAEMKTKVRAFLASKEEAVAKAQESVKALMGTVEKFGKVAAKKSWTTTEMMRSLPILEGFASPLKVHQITLADLPADHANSREKSRIDRCTTCHLGIDKELTTPQALAKIGDREEASRLSAKLQSAKEMLVERADPPAPSLVGSASEAMFGPSYTQLGFHPNDLPGQQRGSLFWVNIFLILCAVVGAVTLGLLERSLAIGLRTFVVGLLLTFMTSTAIAYMAPRETKVEATPLSAGQISQFKAHPRLDLFVGPNSPHSAEKFGCTICHNGQGNATDFNLAAHLPNLAPQEQQWIKEHGYYAKLGSESSMLSTRFLESSCVKCHHQLTGLIRNGVKEEAPKLLRGFNLVRESGCFGCHEIHGSKDGRSVGPDLRLEPSPALDFLTSAEQEKLKSEGANPPGTYRKVGPSLRRLAEKTNEEWTLKWIADPRGFRADTKMPHYYDLGTNSKQSLAESAPEQQNFPAAEMHAITHYLLRESKSALAGKDTARLALISGPQSLPQLQKTLSENGLSETQMKELLDLSNRFADLARLSAPEKATSLNPLITRQQQIHQKLHELQRRRAALEATGGPAAELDAVKSELAPLVGELPNVTQNLITLATPTTVVNRIVDGDNEPVTLSEKVDLANGRRLLAEKGCLACHAHEKTAEASDEAGLKSPAVISDANFGPDLSRIADKIAPALPGATAQKWLTQWLLNPNIYHARTRMPITHLRPSEANDLAAWLLSQKTGWQGKPTDPKTPTLNDYRDLLRVYLGKAPGVTKTDVEAFMGEPGKVIKGISAKRLETFARDAEERQLIEDQVTEDQMKWYIGKKAIARLGCVGCHDIPGFETAKPIGVGLNDWGRKDSSRLAFEDGEAFVRAHFNLVPNRTTKAEVEARIKELKDKKAKERLSSEEVSRLDALQTQTQANERIAELEAKRKAQELSAAESKELNDLQKFRYFASDEGKEPMEQIFYDQLLAHRREGFLQVKLAAPRAFDHNRIRPWDERTIMPQFRFARVRKLPNESDEAYRARQEKLEAEAREAVMTFILGLVAEPIPARYVYNPSADKKAEGLGRQVLEKFNCQSCHQIRPGEYQLKADEATLASLIKTHANVSNQDGPIDHVYLGHSAWFGNGPPSPETLSAFGFLDPQKTEGTAEADDGPRDVVRLAEAMRFVGKDRITRDLLAGTEIYLPPGSYQVSQPFGGTWTELMVKYVITKTNDKDPGKARGVLPPPLNRQGERVQPDWLYKFLLNPGVVRPESYMMLRMPKFNMSQEEARALVNYFTAVSRLSNPGGGITSPFVTIEQRDADYWRRTALQYGNWVRESIAQTEEEIRQIDVLKKSANDEKDAEKKKVLEAQVTEKEATLMPLQERLKKLKAVAEDVAKHEKALTGLIGDVDRLKKEQMVEKDETKRGAIDKSLGEKEIALRDQKLRDPYIQQSYKLTLEQNLCLKCHNLGNSTNIAGAQGPNLALAAERLRPEWTEQWIAHPKRLFPYAPVMPQNFPNEKDPLKWQWQDKFVGTPAQQTRAVRDLIMDLPKLNELLAKQPPPPATPPAGGTQEK